MRRKYADYSKHKDIIEKDYRKLDTDNDSYFGAVCLLDIKQVAQKWRVAREGREDDVILDMGYRWLTLYPREENFCIIAIYDVKSELVEFYFDICKKIKYKPKVPSMHDLYLDVVLTNRNEVIFLDEDELNEAYKSGNIKQEDYELAKRTADKILNKFHGQADFDRLKQIADEYLGQLIRMPIE